MLVTELHTRLARLRAADLEPVELILSPETWQELQRDAATRPEDLKAPDFTHAFDGVKVVQIGGARGVAIVYCGVERDCSAAP